MQVQQTGDLLGRSTAHATLRGDAELGHSRTCGGDPAFGTATAIGRVDEPEVKGGLRSELERTQRREVFGVVTPA